MTNTVEFLDKNLTVGELVQTFQPEELAKFIIKQNVIISELNEKLDDNVKEIKELEEQINYYAE